MFCDLRTVPSLRYDTVMRRYSDWLRQAQRDLEHAHRSTEAGDYEWACFAAQQAAEKALKALHLALGVEAWGHSVFRALTALPPTISVPAELQIHAKALDKHYIPPRYPNSYPEGAPLDFYTRKDANEALHAAEAVVKFCADHIARLTGSAP